jgi:hypothetical protein
MTNAELIEWLSQQDPTLEAGMLYEGCGPHALPLCFDIDSLGQNVGVTQGELQEYSDATNNVIAAGLQPNEPALILYRKSPNVSRGTPLTPDQLRLLQKQQRVKKAKLPRFNPFGMSYGKKRNISTNLKTKG